MAYIPITWVNNSTPAINATNLNHIETGIDEAHDCQNILYTPFGDIIATNVQAAITELENEKISKSTLDANSIVKADSDDTPVVLTVAEQTLVGRITAGSIDDLSTTQVRALINVENGSQETSTAHVNTAGAVMETDYNAQTILAATADDTPVALGIGTSELVGRTAGGNVDSLTMVEARTILNVEDGSTADQTGAEIKALYEVEALAFTDTKNTKLTGIDESADVTDSTTVAAAGAVMDVEFTAADEVMVGTGAGTHGQITLAASEFLAKKAAGAAMNVTATEARAILGVEAGATADQTGAEIKTLYQAEANAFTDTKNTKLTGIDESADVTDSTTVAAAGAIMDSDIAASEGFMRKTSAGSYVAIKSYLNATTDPTANEDSGDGYAVGSRWINVTGDNEYVCLDSTVGSAVWTETTGGGGGIDTVVTKTSAYTATVDDNTVLCNGTSAGFTITLPASSGNSGLKYNIKKIDSSVNTITIDGNASETIDGNLTVSLSSQYDSYTIQCDGTNWYIL